ncbi:MAG: sulfatase/phosphatase domain-containing protein, partial [Verrucomicrobiota bacterium]
DPTCANYSLNTPLRGYKGECWEGGIRIPYIVEWPAKIPGGITFEEPASSLDIVPTLLAAAGAPPAEKTDGVDVTPFLSGAKTGVLHETLFWRYHIYKAVRKGRMKLVKERNGKDQLFDLAADLTESKDLAADRPDLLAELNRDLETWEREMSPPRWNQTRPLRPDGRPLFGNLLSNGNMEEAHPGGIWPAAWYHSESGVRWSNEKYVSGRHSLQIAENAAGKQQIGQWRSVAGTATPGSRYRLQWMWHHTQASNISAHLRFFDVSGKFIEQKSTAASGSNGGFEPQRLDAEAPANAATVDIVFMRAVNGAGRVWIDDVDFSDQP